ncbi:GNAT family N-acetyltransferase [uncultured Erythrobacter sp.]|uniref:GNAT family N-acetyltransferase n=1 Tax=uncultured Erythrobacter sp. TaxID=263913 RepID=UPI0026319FB1|nr:GNAT family N-acetyltransferase [uncultured Erythrobacter sp.]
MRLIDCEEAASTAFLAAWQALAEQASEPNPFFESWFALGSLDHFSEDSAPELFAHYSDGQLIGLLPLARKPRYYGYPVPHIAGWLHSNAFCGSPLAARGFERAFWRSLLAHLDQEAGRALFLHLPQLPADGPLNAALDAVLAESGRRAVTVDAGERAMLSPPDDYPHAQAYLDAAMSTKKRKELRRQRKRLSELGTLTVERLEGSVGIDTWIAEFLALEAEGWKGEAGSALASAQSTRSFFTATLTSAAQAHKLERLALRLDGKPVAMLANFITMPGVFSFKTTFDEAYSRFSPGLLLQIENLDLVERPGFEWADSCAVEGHTMIERIWREKRRIISRNIAIGGSLRRTAFRALMAYETRGQSPE